MLMNVFVYVVAAVFKRGYMEMFVTPDCAQEQQAGCILMRIKAAGRLRAAEGVETG